MFTKRTIVISIATFVTVGLIGIALVSDGTPNSPASRSAQENAQQDSVPSFALENYDGKTVSLTDFKAPIKVINVWASWCPFCTDELPDFAELQKKYPEQLAVIAINRGEDKQTAQAFTDKVGISDDLTFLLDPEESFYKDIGGFAMPETLFVDSSGTVFRHHRGPLTLKEMEGIVEKKISSLGNSQTTSDGDSYGCNGSQCQLNATNSSSSNHGN